ncbi:MAG: tryptophan--tRNA ligase [Planctomycetes bacterium]|nr:tryptophan--tRNA ligase [Planctomycetota bacterium]
MTLTSDKPRVLTGDTPTASLHLGHYVGSIENRLAMQELYESYFFVANLHALTTRVEDTVGIRAATISIVKDWLACGIDPKKATLFVQSEIPAVAELTWYFAMLLGYGRLMKNPTIKDEIRVKNLGDNYSFGFLMYPVGQIADILAFRPAFVPVGEDQIPHIEMTREVARKFDQLYCGVDPHAADADYAKLGGVFPIPEAKTGRIARLTGIDGKNKMSKSLDNAIFLSDDPKTVQKKCNKIFTGRGSMDDPPVLENNTIIEYLTAFEKDPRKVEALIAEYAAGKIGDGHLKKEVSAAINLFLEPVRERHAKFSDDDVIDILKDGCARANATAEATLWQAKQAAKFDFFERKITLG